VSKSGLGVVVDTRYRNGLLTYPPCSVEGLSHFVVTSTTAFQQGRRYIDNCHNLPQSEYIYDESGNQICDDILRLEDLPEAFDKLMEEHGNAARMGATQALDTSGVCPGLGVGDLSVEAKQLMREVYGDDFKRLNYSST